MYRKSLSRRASRKLAFKTANRTRKANIVRTFSRGGIRF